MSTVADLLGNYQHVIDDLTLVTAGAGAFEVAVDGAILFSKKGLGRHAAPGEVLDLFTDLVGPGVRRYGE